MNEERYIQEQLKKIQTQGVPWEPAQSDDIKVPLRVDEKISPAKFKPDPLIPGGYVANSLTLRAMRPLVLVAGAQLDELVDWRACVCGDGWDAQFWKFCPFCGKNG